MMQSLLTNDVFEPLPDIAEEMFHFGHGVPLASGSSCFDGCEGRFHIHGVRGHAIDVPV